jgi:hypothetical protein
VLDCITRLQKVEHLMIFYFPEGLPLYHD